LKLMFFWRSENKRRGISNGAKVSRYQMFIKF
jgi:hypothetical protein